MDKQHTNSRGVVAALIISSYSIAKELGDRLVTIHNCDEQRSPTTHISGLDDGSEVEQ